MPELPEVETVLSGLKQFMTDQKILEAKIFTKKIRNLVPKNMAKTLENKGVVGLYRRAKYIVIDLENNHSMILHLGMSGVMKTYLKDGKKFEKDRHDHLWLKMEDGNEIVFRDPRRFGVLDLLPTGEVSSSKYFSHLGLEPLSNEFSVKKLRAILSSRKVAIKQAIMDQKIVVGVGNIYASEALFKSGIDPRRAAYSLSLEEATLLVRNIKSILRLAIKNGGSTLRDYRNIGGERGYFQMHFSVYDREGRPCPDCTCNIEKTGGVKRIVQGNRSTFYCESKQR
ncbi:MAG TPA: bifunctional DNA-formamidopyrimidine glycosylase/DNA-(apurinic or apyrimidinic site) lyase [Alphaproteobacteria bacterium]|nr:bifunctional DNA-formamidopyrimidine glycosylase/DNA-(apurinic or apyrimidinic site) lyase [Alphaproteobacteria bacterium]HOO52209.1 bifunctional DNA-formamidopyrimidine glycosylase/DNA-(apurinic or apyrimidinic site) lyase [Alphaproteobacteria bacterium]